MAPKYKLTGNPLMDDFFMYNIRGNTFKWEEILKKKGIAYEELFSFYCGSSLTDKEITHETSSYMMTELLRDMLTSPIWKGISPDGKVLLDQSLTMDVSLNYKIKASEKVHIDSRGYEKTRSVFNLLDKDNNNIFGFQTSPDLRNLLSARYLNDTSSNNAMDIIENLVSLATDTTKRENLF